MVKMIMIPFIQEETDAWMACWLSQDESYTEPKQRHPAISLQNKTLYFLRTALKYVNTLGFLSSIQLLYNN